METLEGKGYSSSLFIPRYLSYIKAERKRCKIKNILIIFILLDNINLAIHF
jgi:hypothetical protein